MASTSETAEGNPDGQTQAGGQPLLCLRNVAKTFPPAPERGGRGLRATAHRAVDDLSITVHRGELFGLLGPSGCGKTTTLRLILGVETTDRGMVSFNGHDITAIPAERRGFGIVFQDYALFTEINVFENIAFGLRDKGKAHQRSGVESRTYWRWYGYRKRSSRGDLRSFLPASSRGSLLRGPWPSNPNFC